MILKVWFLDQHRHHHLLEVQISRPTSDLLNQKLSSNPSLFVLTNPSGDFDAHKNLRITGVERLGE